MSEEKKGEKWIPAHERAIQLLETDSDEHWRTLWAMYQEAKVPEEAQEDLLEAFCQNAPKGMTPTGLEKQAEESEKEEE